MIYIYIYIYIHVIHILCTCVYIYVCKYISRGGPLLGTEGIPYHTAIS